ncbi:hypothetical protein BD560DRAFT_442784 [Blakeslea trispora]|nr:hypothetical protein BD560DRAFT_442784 [Blakeslea trispora]
MIDYQLFDYLDTESVNHPNADQVSVFSLVESYPSVIQSEVLQRSFETTSRSVQSEPIFTTLTEEALARHNQQDQLADKMEQMKLALEEKIKQLETQLVETEQDISQSRSDIEQLDFMDKHYQDQSVQTNITKQANQSVQTETTKQSNQSVQTNITKQSNQFVQTETTKQSNQSVQTNIAKQETNQSVQTDKIKQINQSVQAEITRQQSNQSVQTDITKQANQSVQTNIAKQSNQSVQTAMVKQEIERLQSKEEEYKAIIDQTNQLVWDTPFIPYPSSLCRQLPVYHDDDDKDLCDYHRERYHKAKVTFEQEKQLYPDNHQVTLNRLRKMVYYS